MRACATTTALTHTGTPRTHPHPNTEHRKYAVIKWRAVQGGSDARRLDDRTDARIARRTRTPSAACILPANREGKGAGTWGPGANGATVRRASEASERSGRGEGGCVHYSFMADGSQIPWPATVTPCGCGGKVWDPPPVNIVLWDRARECKRARRGSRAYMASVTPQGSQSDVKFLAKLATTGKRTQSRASMHARRGTRAPGPILTDLRRPDPAWLTGHLCNEHPIKEGFRPQA